MSKSMEVSPQNEKPAAIKKNRLRDYLISMAIMLIIAGLTLHFILKDTQLDQIWASLLAARLSFVFMGFACMLLSTIFSSLSIRLLISTAMQVHTPYHVCLCTAFIGYYFNNITPSATGGQPMQVYYLHRCHVDVAGASVIFLSMTMMYNFTLILFSSLMLILKPQLILQSLYGLKYLLIWGYVANGFLMFFCFALISFPHQLQGIVLWFMERLSRRRLLRNYEKKLEKTKTFFLRYAASSQSFRASSGKLIALLAYHMLQIFFMFLVPFFAAKALNPDFQGFWDCFALNSVLNLATAGFPTPGSVGITESAFLTIFRSTFHEDTVSVMLLTRMLNFYAFLLLSALVTLVAFSTAGSRLSRVMLISEKRAKHSKKSVQNIQNASENTGKSSD